MSKYDNLMSTSSNNADAAGKPPAYKPTDYSTRYSYEPLAANKNIDDYQKSSTYQNAIPDDKDQRKSYNLSSFDPVDNKGIG